VEENGISVLEENGYGPSLKFLKLEKTHRYATII